MLRCTEDLLYEVSDTWTEMPDPQGSTSLVTAHPPDGDVAASLSASLLQSHQGPSELLVSLLPPPAEEVRDTDHFAVCILFLDDSDQLPTRAAIPC